MKLKLVVFDVDGTLVDSQAHIVASMTEAFRAAGLTPPDRATILSIVGLSLPVAMARLAPTAPSHRRDLLVEGYRTAFRTLRERGDAVAASPLFPGARAVIDALHARDEVLLGIATGKSRRGLVPLIEAHGLQGLFQTMHCADDHPSKPDPAMLDACLRDCGVDPRDAVIVGDTSFDMEMGRAAGVTPIGVSWGYHAAEGLERAGAARVIDSFDALPGVLDETWERADG